MMSNRDQNNEQQQRRQMIWKNSQGQEIYDPKNKDIRYKLIKRDIIARTPICTIYKGLKRCEGKGPVSFQPLLIKKYEHSQRKQKQKEVPKEYFFLTKKPILLQQFKMQLLQYKQQYYVLYSNSQSTLYDKFKYGVRQFKQHKDFKNNFKTEFYSQFKRQMVQIFTTLHKKDLSIFLGGLRPAHIGVTQKFEGQFKKIYTYSVLDFSVANIKQAKNYLNLYDLSYLAPEYKQGLSIKSDYWSFGCILYELVSNGQKLINDPSFHELANHQKQNYIASRLKELICKIKLANEGKHKFTFDAVEVIRQCLKLKPEERSLLQLNQKKQKQLQNQLPAEQYKFWKNRIIYDISMQIFRLTLLQDNMLSVFEEFYFSQQKTVKKFHIYPLLKFASCYYLQAFNKLKDKAKCYGKNEKWDKYSQVKKIQDQRKIADIREKAGSKMIKEMEQEKNPLKNQVLGLFPEIKDQNIVHPRQLYHLYWSYVKSELCKLQNKNFYNFFYCIHFYMKEQTQMQAFLKFDQIVLRPGKKQSLKQPEDPQITYFHCANKIAEAMQAKIKSITSGSQQKSIELKMMNELQNALSKVLYY